MPNKRRYNTNNINIAAELQHNFHFSSLFSSEVTGPIFTKLLHDVEALVVHAYTKQLCIPLWSATAKSEGNQF